MALRCSSPVIRRRDLFATPAPRGLETFPRTGSSSRVAFWRPRGPLRGPRAPKTARKHLVVLHDEKIVWAQEVPGTPRPRGSLGFRGLRLSHVDPGVGERPRSALMRRETCRHTRRRHLEDREGQLAARAPCGSARRSRARPPACPDPRRRDLCSQRRPPEVWRPATGTISLPEQFFNSRGAR